MKIYEVMQNNVYSLTQNHSIKDAVNMMRDKNIGFVVIEQEKMPIGIVTDRDLLLSVNKELNLSTKLAKVMKKYVLTINQNADVADASDMMGYMQIKRLVVTNDFNQIVGILSLSDLARNVLTEEYAFEALVEISYDYSIENKQNDNLFQISAYRI